MSRPIEAIIDLPALRHNLSVAKNLANGAKVFAVVKANAYGHGLDRVMPGLVDADGLAVVEFDAALRIRAKESSKPVLMLEGFFGEQELLRLKINTLRIVGLAPSHKIPPPSRFAPFGLRSPYPSRIENPEIIASGVSLSSNRTTVPWFSPSNTVPNK